MAASSLLDFPALPAPSCSSPDNHFFSLQLKPKKWKWTEPTTIARFQYHFQSSAEQSRSRFWVKPWQERTTWELERASFSPRRALCPFFFLHSSSGSASDSRAGRPGGINWDLRISQVRQFGGIIHLLFNMLKCATISEYSCFDLFLMSMRNS